MPRGSAPGERRGGRAAGTPNKLTSGLKEMILGAMNDACGQQYLLEQDKKNTTRFMK